MTKLEFEFNTEKTTKNEGTQELEKVRSAVKKLFDTAEKICDNNDLAFRFDFPGGYDYYTVYTGKNVKFEDDESWPDDAEEPGSWISSY